MAMSPSDLWPVTVRTNAQIVVEVTAETSIFVLYAIVVVV